MLALVTGALPGFPSVAPASRGQVGKGTPTCDDLLPSLVFEVSSAVARVDSRVIAQLFREHGPMVYRRALRMLGNPADAEEASQEIFIRVVRAADGFEDRSRVTTWLYQITTNYCLNALRDRQRHAAAFEAHLAPDAESRPAAIAPDDMAALRGLLSRAPEREAAAVVCVFLDGMTHEEAAEVLKVSKRTVGNLIERFQDWMKKEIGADENDDARPMAAPSGGRNRA